MGSLVSIDPASGREVERFAEHTKAERETAVSKASRAFKDWRERPLSRRADLMRGVAPLLRSRASTMARTMAKEMGKPVRDGVAEVEKCAWVCEFYADNAERFLADEPVATDAARSFVSYEPLGPILAIMPWNFPFWQVFRFAAPALMAGNVGLLKHASNVTRCSLQIEEAFRDAGFPGGVFQSLRVGSSRVRPLIEDPRIKGVTLTGSEKAGIEVAAASGRSLKKTVLELGGSDPFIVLDDADVDRAAAVAAKARCINSGQSCIAAKRFIVARDVEEDFLQRFTKALAALRMGDPMLETTQIGPQAREDLLRELDRQVKGSLSKGARVLLGDQRAKQPGFYYPATLLAGVGPGMPAYEEEVFGPVAAVISARDDEEAVAIANDSRYGLGASIWSKDPVRALALGRRLEVGCVFVNGLVKSDPRLPFGGVKMSGYGRELGVQGIREFVNVKTVWVEKG